MGRLTFNVAYDPADAKTISSRGSARGAPRQRGRAEPGCLQGPNKVPWTGVSRVVVTEGEAGAGATADSRWTLVVVFEVVTDGSVFTSMGQPAEKTEAQNVARKAGVIFQGSRGFEEG